jgi:transcription elongation factor Elf1
MIAKDTALAQQRCPRCAQPMKLIRRTQRFGGLPDLCTFECQACGMSHTEECKPTIWHAADIYRKQAKACRELATQARGDDRTFWLGLSDCWLKLAQVDDEQKR